MPLKSTMHDNASYCMGKGTSTETWIHELQQKLDPRCWQASKYTFRNRFANTVTTEETEKGFPTFKLKRPYLTSIITSFSRSSGQKW